jgi:ATP-dependent protease ClpP protease subunit
MQPHDFKVNRRKALLTAMGGLSVAVGVGRADAQTVSQPATYIVFQSGITGQTVNQLLSQIVQVQTSEIYLVISSNGGEVMVGIAAYNFLRALPKKLTTHNIGNVDSIAMQSSLRVNADTQAHMLRSCFTG